MEKGIKKIEWEDRPMNEKAMEQTEEGTGRKDESNREEKNKWKKVQMS